VSFLKRVTLLVAATAVFAIALAAAADAQVSFPPPFPYRNFDPDSAVRLEVTPREAEVYVDGYYAGIVDDFDGVFQRLRLPSGGHEITVYRDGFRSFTQRVYLTPDSTLKLKHKMEPLGVGEIAEARPLPAVPAQVEPQPRVLRPPSRGPVGPRGRRLPPPTAPDTPPPQENPAGSEQAPPGVGTLMLHVQPADAALLIDGERWRGPSEAERVIELPDGQHTIQISKRGFVSYLTDVRVRRGETTTLDVSLRNNP